MGNWLKWCSPRAWPRGTTTTMGIAIGAAMGAATDEMAVWVAAGAAVGVALEFTKARSR